MWGLLYLCVCWLFVRFVAFICILVFACGCLRLIIVVCGIAALFRFLVGLVECVCYLL